MTEENNEVASKTVDKVDHTKEYNCCKHSYDSLIATTKAFVFNFNNLTPEEKVSFKSLHTYIKQLQKCMDVLKPQQTLKSSKKTEETNENSEVKVKRSTSRTQKTQNTEKSENAVKTEKTEVSPTAILVEETKTVSEPVEEKKTKTTTKRNPPVKKA